MEKTKKISFKFSLGENGLIHQKMKDADFLNLNPDRHVSGTYLLSCKSNYEPIARKERSFSIFSEEKMLDAGGIRSSLSHLNLDEKKLAFYDTPEYCLNDFISERKADMTLLICENKDIWFNVRRLMFEDEKRFFWYNN